MTQTQTVPVYKKKDFATDQMVRWCPGCGDYSILAQVQTVFAELGIVLPPPAEVTKQPHNYAGRILALIGTFGLYALWWAADLMREGNAHVHEGQAWEDALAAVAEDSVSVPDHGTSPWS